MPRYEYRCPDGHVTELVLPMADDKPETVTCERAHVDDEDAPCLQPAARVFHAPIAVHWSGAGGSYYEDSYRNDSGRYGWKRRKNAADDLPVEVS